MDEEAVSKKIVSEFLKAIKGEQSLFTLSNNLCGRVPYSYETLRRIVKFFYLAFLHLGFNEDFSSFDNEASDVDKNIVKRESNEERRELNQLYLAVARRKVFDRRMQEAISKLQPIQVKRADFPLQEKTQQCAFLCISDLHYGSQFVVNGLNGEVVNKYDKEVFKARMRLLLDKISEDADILVVDEWRVCFLGDFVEGILRPGSLTLLNSNVIDDVIELSEYLSCWCVELSRIVNVPIEISIVGGNHDIQRLLGSKPMFEEENVAKIIHSFLKVRLQEFADFIKIKDYSDVSVISIYDLNLLLLHGIENDLKKTIVYFSEVYNIDLDYVVAGHFHSPKNESLMPGAFGDKESIRVGSIMGINPYSKKLRIGAKPSAYVALFEDCGKTWSRNYYLG